MRWGSRIHCARRAGVGNRERSKRRARPDMGEVRPDATRRRRAADRVAACAVLLEHHRRVRRGSGLSCKPCAEPRRRVGEDVKAHVRVLQPAELSALAAIPTGLVGVEQHPVRLIGDHVDLPVQLGHPEAVDHVVGVNEHLHRCPHGYVDLVRCHGGGPGIPHLPPELVTDHANGQFRLLRGRRRSRRNGRVADEEDVREEEESREHPDRDDEAENDDDAERCTVAVPDAGYPGSRPPHPCGHEDQRHDREGERRTGKHVPPEGIDASRSLAVRAQHVLLRAAASSEEQGRRHCRERTERRAFHNGFSDPNSRTGYPRRDALKRRPSESRPRRFGRLLRRQSSRRSAGKRIASRIDSRPVKSIARRSMPRPIPPVGGMP